VNELVDLQILALLEHDLREHPVTLLMRPAPVDDRLGAIQLHHRAQVLLRIGEGRTSGPTVG
jgi:hypothetical protein